MAQVQLKGKLLIGAVLTVKTGFQRFCADWRRRQSFYQGSVDKGANHSGEFFEGKDEDTFSQGTGRHD